MSQTFIVWVLSITIVLVVGGIIRSGLRNTRRLRGTSIDELLEKKSDEIDETFKNWVSPPELNRATPRPICRSAAAIERSRSRPRNILYLTIAVASFGFAALVYYGMSVTLLRHELREFLNAPRWYSWMVAPIVIYGAGIAAFLLSGQRRRRKERRLLQWGIPARARVTAMAWGGTTRCIVEYQDAAGVVHRIDQNRPLVPAGGAAVETVLYDPDNPGDFISYPGARYAIEGSD